MSHKILYLINGLGTGGAEYSLAEMLPGFIEANIQPIVVCFYHRQEGVEHLVTQYPLKIHFLTGKKLLGRLWAVRHIIAQEKPDLIHATLFEADLVSRLAAIGSGIPVLNSLVNTSYAPIRLKNPNLTPFKLWSVKTIDSWTGRYLVNHFHAVSYAVKYTMAEALRIPQERITVVHRGRDPARLGVNSTTRRQQARAMLGLTPEAQVIVNVGRQEYQKGHKYLLQAMAELAPHYPNMVLLIVGRHGHATTELQQLHHTTNLGEQVRFLGHRDDVPEILAAADLFVFPSLYEGLPGAVIEAMALGLPIVAADIPPVREVVEQNQNALLAEPANPDELATNILALLQDQTMAEAFSKRSREIFEARFTLDHIVKQMVQLYHQIAAS